MSQELLSVLIVGCGKIAGGFDMGMGSSQLPCTHAGAYQQDGRFKLQACVEPCDTVRAQFMEYWGVAQGFGSLEEALSANLSIDIVSICSPTALHKTDVLSAIQFNPKLIFCEKPVTESCGETQALIAACEAAEVLLMVNHNRRWDPEVEQLKLALVDGRHGKLRSVVGYYNKGTLNNGSHLIDLLHYLIGDLRVIATAEGIVDLKPEDPTISALLCSVDGVPVHLVTGNADDFSLFELQLICADAVLTMRDGGQFWHTRKTIESDRFSGYRVLDEGSLRPGGYRHTTLRAVNNIYEALTSGTKLLSTGDSAFRAQHICEQIVGWQQD